MKLAGEHKRHRESRHSRGRNQCGIKIVPSASRLAKRTSNALAGGLRCMAEDFGETPEYFKGYMCEERA